MLSDIRAYEEFQLKFYQIVRYNLDNYGLVDPNNCKSTDEFVGNYDRSIEQGKEE